MSVDIKRRDQQRPHNLCCVLCSVYPKQTTLDASRVLPCQVLYIKVVSACIRRLINHQTSAVRREHELQCLFARLT